MFDSELFASRRKKLLGKLRPDSVAIIPTAPTSTYSHDTEYIFRPNSDFFYLTGFREPESVAILSNMEGRKPFTLFVRPRDPQKETWTGRRSGIKGAVDIYCADEAFDIGEFETKLPSFLENTKSIYHFPGRYKKSDMSLLRAWQAVRMKWREGIDAPVEMVDLGVLMHEMRLIKTAKDMELQRQACRITAEAVELAMRAVKPLINEREIEALVNHYFRATGGFGYGFPTIVASGASATILHYIENEATIGEHDLVLLDCGVEYEMFNGDITRTFPASGKFSPEQRVIYDIVLTANKVGIEKCTIDNGMDDVHKCAVKILVDGLVDLKLLSGSADEIIEKETYKKYYMHKTGHWLGVDVHDVGSQRKGGKIRKFEPGMVTTVEPGLYLPEDDETLPASFRGIGVRIEDDIHITSKGPENLTVGCLKDAGELEGMMGG
ncbi:MAG: aminopeptidase P N-terminal domain-containing protein [bacterium]|nr:aminopeptidase P N-terminal domain-containing protein [bacterium]